jgi:hypothetical protein
VIPVTRIAIVAATLALVSIQSAAPGALAQTLDQPFVARASVSVANDSPVPQTVTGTSVAPFQLLPHQQARLDMRAMPPPSPTPGSTVPVQFQYSVGQGAGPRCHGTIEMSLRTEGPSTGSYQVTDCVAHSLGTDGADCHIAVKAQDAACQGGLAFSVQ